MHGPLPVPLAGMPADIYKPFAAGAFMAWVRIFLMPLHDPHSPTISVLAATTNTEQCYTGASDL